MTKLIVAFRNFANAPNKDKQYVVPRNVVAVVRLVYQRYVYMGRNRPPNANVDAESLYTLHIHRKYVHCKPQATFPLSFMIFHRYLQHATGPRQ